MNNKCTSHNEEVEGIVLGAMLKSSVILNDGIASLKEEDFYIKSNKTVFTAIKRVYEKGLNVDIASVSNDLLLNDRLDYIGGLDYLLNLVDSVITFENMDQNIIIIKEHSLLRNFITSLDKIIEKHDKNDFNDINDFIQESEISISKVTEKRRVGTFKKSKEVADLVKQEIEDLKEASQKDSVTGVNTGYVKLNELLHGFHGGELIVLAARPGIGKTAFALNIAYNAVSSSKPSPVAFFSCEMPANQLMKRIVSAESGVHLDSLQTGFGLSPANKIQLRSSCEVIGQRKFYIDDSSGITISDIIAKTKKLKGAEPDLGLIVIDYLGLVSSGLKKSESRQQDIQFISQTLKKLALELKIPILLLAQLNRNVDQRDSKEPILSDLRESGSIEQDADIVMFIHLDEKSKKNKKDAQGGGEDATDSTKETLLLKEKNDARLVYITVAKNRHGKTGQFYLLFKKAISKFENPSEKFQSDLAAALAAHSH